MNKVIEIIKSDKFKTIAAVAAAIVMYFTPDPIDQIITVLLAGFGISTLVISEKK